MYNRFLGNEKSGSDLQENFHMEYIYSSLSTTTTLQIERNRLQVDMYYSKKYEHEISSYSEQLGISF